MLIRGDYSSQVLMKLTQLDGEGLKLTKGEILRGLVESVKNNGMLMVTLKGRTIEAFSELPLAAGQELFLLVDGFKEGKTILKVLTPEMMAERNQERVAGALRFIGLDSDPDFMIAAQKLLQHGLPVTRENVETMVRAARQAGAGLTPETMEAAAYVIARGGKPDPQILKALLQFIQNPVMAKAALEKAAEVLPRLNYPAVMAEPLPPVANSQASTANTQATAEIKLTLYLAADDASAPRSSATATPQTGASEPASVKITPSMLVLTPGYDGSLETAKNDAVLLPDRPALTAASNPDANRQAPATGQLIQTGSTENEPGMTPVNVPHGETEPVPLSKDQTVASMPQPARGTPEPSLAAPTQYQDEAVSPGVSRTTGENAAVISPKSSESIKIPTRGETGVINLEPEAKPLFPQMPEVQAGLSRQHILDKSADVIRILLPLLSIQGDDGETLAVQIKQFFESNQEVLKTLLPLKDILDNELQADPKPAAQEARSLIDLAVKEYLGQAVFNTLNRTEVAAQGYYYFLMPVLINQQEHLVELKIYQEDKGNRTTSTDNEFKVALSLNTSNLGIVVFHLTWHRQEGLIIQGAVENSSVQRLISTNISSLTQRLEEMGFNVRFLGMKVAESREKFRPSMEAEVNPPKILGIDIKI